MSKLNMYERALPYGLYVGAASAVIKYRPDNSLISYEPRNKRYVPDINLWTKSIEQQWVESPAELFLSELRLQRPLGRAVMMMESRPIVTATEWFDDSLAAVVLGDGTIRFVDDYQTLARIKLGQKLKADERYATKDAAMVFAGSLTALSGIIEGLDSANLLTVLGIVGTSAIAASGISKLRKSEIAKINSSLARYVPSSIDFTQAPDQRRSRDALDFVVRTLRSSPQPGEVWSAIKPDVFELAVASGNYDEYEEVDVDTNISKARILESAKFINDLAQYE